MEEKKRENFYMQEENKNHINSTKVNASEYEDLTGLAYKCRESWKDTGLFLI